MIDVPEEYLLWFSRKGKFPQGGLDYLIEMTLTVKVKGLDNLVKPLKHL
ncbi:hypothetical protein ARSQ2_02306 [Arsenophonus endosymbiont of Bemisia tabaci Q2]|nr:hypothetical protein ARSQ2_02306 [Arsenophonus endosymbiont of Bemisia tabaci Q2]